MADSATTRIFVVLVCFWFLLSFLSNIFGVELEKTDLASLKPGVDTSPGESSSWIDSVTNEILNKALDLPVINTFKPLIKIMAFQYTDQVPAVFSIFLDMTLVFTGFIVYKLWKGG